MPLAFPLLEEVLIPLLAWILASLGAVWLARLLNGLDISIPHLGQPFHGVVASIRRSVENALVDTFNALAAHTITPVLQGIASSVNYSSLGLLRIAAATYNALDHLTHVSVHAIVKAFIRPLQADLQLLRNGTVATVGATFGFASVLAARIAAQAGRIDHLAQDVIPGLRADVFRGIDHLAKDVIPGALQTAEQYTLGEVGAVEGDVARVEKKVNGLLGGVGSLPLDKLLGLIGYLPYVGALAGALSIEAARTAERCAPKTRLLCTTDQGLWDSLFGDALPILTLAELLLIARVAQDTARTVEPIARDLLEL